MTSDWARLAIGCGARKKPKRQNMKKAAAFSWNGGGLKGEIEGRKGGEKGKRAKKLR